MPDNSYAFANYLPFEDRTTFGEGWFMDAAYRCGNAQPGTLDDLRLRPVTEWSPTDPLWDTWESALNAEHEAREKRSEASKDLRKKALRQRSRRRRTPQRRPGRVYEPVFSPIGRESEWAQKPEEGPKVCSACRIVEPGQQHRCIQAGGTSEELVPPARRPQPARRLRWHDEEDAVL